MSRPSEPFFGWPGWKHLRFAALVSVLGVFWFILVYGGCDAITAHRSTRVRVHLNEELQIPFIPETVLVYMSIYFLFLAAPFILRRKQEFLSLAITLDLIILAAGIGFLLVPAQLAFAPETGSGAFPGLFQFADRLNLSYNLVPSLHVALSVACVAVYARRATRIGKILLWTWATAVAVSTLLTHQHHVLDVITGGLLALATLRSGCSVSRMVEERISPHISNNSEIVTLCCFAGGQSSARDQSARGLAHSKTSASSQHPPHCDDGSREDPLKPSMTPTFTPQSCA